MTSADDTGTAARSPFRLGLALLLAAAALALLAHAFAPRYATGIFATAPNAMVLPKVLLALWGGMALALVAVEWRGTGPVAAGRWATVLWLGAILVGAALLLPVAGFALTVTPVVFASLLAMGERRPLVLLVATAVLGPGLWALFHHVLLIRLPSILPGGLL
ncbi:tripartite tricarboxylate transporter TctB family protein [Jannaschia sp. LMIT008]|uniref:tripartite tricarboxylate transporter TctB family protein n=1 Tax=Jannaschia maritima TaxID=3032585 RepID=UPI002811F337|nr:tripartite tricarboxylate transporter TctB family protein [Jannaschia sp. LMIT008]